MIKFIIEHWQVIIPGLVIPIASIVAKATPTKTDDKILFAVLKFIDLIALNNKPTELNVKTKLDD